MPGVGEGAAAALAQVARDLAAQAVTQAQGPLDTVMWLMVRLANSSVAQLCPPAATRLPFADGVAATVAGRVAASPLPVATLDPAFTKVAMRASRRAQLAPSLLNSVVTARMLEQTAVLAPPDGELAPRAFTGTGAFRGVLSEIGGLDRTVARSGSRRRRRGGCAPLARR